MNPLISRYLLLVLLVAAGCIEPYDPPTAEQNPDFLVVDAFINANDGMATVSITHTLPLGSVDRPPPEANATVRINLSDGRSYELASEGNGIYQAVVPVNFQVHYGLYILTDDNKEYRSDLITLKRTPEIDSINFFIDNYNVLNINVNTHDPTGASRFYRWEYDQTYEYHSQYTSSYIIRPNGDVELRETWEMIDVCYKTDYLTNILVGTSKLLTEDVISNQNLVKFRKGSIEITEKYSILVKQHTLSEEAYNYWAEVKKTTESLGGLFDPMPGEVAGNIHCITDPSEPVIGYFNGSEVSEKRIFISKFDLPVGFSWYQHEWCEIDSIPENLIDRLPRNTILIGGIYSPGSLRPTGYTTASPSCIDCRLFGGGVLTKPDFWE